MTQETITMTPKELARYEIIKRLLNKEINGPEADKQIGLSTRQVRNLKTEVKRHGVKGVIHGSRGKPSNRKLSDCQQKIKLTPFSFKKRVF